MAELSSRAEETAEVWPRVVIGIPSERTRITAAAHSIERIAAQGYPFLQIGYTRCDVARNRMVIRMLSHNEQMVAEDRTAESYTHLLMLDSDHIHPVDIVERLARWVQHDPNKLVVGGLNFRRGAPFDPCAYMTDAEGTLYPLLEWKQGCFPVDVLGSGCILIAASVFYELPFPWFGYSYERNEALDWPACGIEALGAGVQWPGTDIWFSQRCEAAGIQQWVDTTTSSPHILETSVTEDSWRSWKDAHGADELPQISREVLATVLERDR